MKEIDEEEMEGKIKWGSLNQREKVKPERKGGLRKFEFQLGRLD